MVKINSKTGWSIFNKYGINDNRMIKAAKKSFPNAEIVRIAYTQDEEDLEVLEDDKQSTGGK